MANWSTAQIDIYDLNVFDALNVKKLFVEQQDDTTFIHRYKIVVNNIKLVSDDDIKYDIKIDCDGRWSCEEEPLINDLLKLVPTLNMEFMEYEEGDNYIQYIEYKNGIRIGYENNVLDSALGKEILGTKYIEELLNDIQ